MLDSPTVDDSPVVYGLIYPTRQVPLIFIAGFALVISLAVRANFGTVPSIPGLALMFFATSWLLKYAYVLFDSITAGEAQPPVLSYEMITPFSDWRPLAQIGVIAGLYSGLYQLSHWVPSALMILLSAMVLLLLPASVALLASTRNLLQAVNPIALAKFIGAVGWAYASLVAGELLVIVLGRVFAPSSPLDLLMPRFFASLGIAYLWLAIYCVLGSVIFNKRLQLGLDTAFSPEQSEAKDSADIADEQDKIIDEIYRHWRVKSFQNAWAALERHVNSAKNSADELLWIHRRVLDWSDASFGERVAGILLPKLLEQRRYTDAVNVARSALARNKQFRPASSTDLVRMVDVARQAGARDVATQLLIDFEQFFPDDPRQERVVELRQTLGVKSSVVNTAVASQSSNAPD
jgi:hypothetical protein